MPDRNVWRAGRKIAGVTAASVALLGTAIGVSQAATVPPHSHSAVVVMRNDSNYHITDYKLQNADPMTGCTAPTRWATARLYAVHWT